MKRKWQTLMTGVALFSGIVGSSSMAQASATQGPVKLTLATWDGSDPTVAAIFKAAVSAFEKSHPNVTVQVLNDANGTYWTKLQTEMAGGAPPDIFEMGESDFKRYWLAGTLTNLSPYAQKSKLSINDIYPGIRSDVLQGNALAAVPAGPETFGILYNKQLFKQAHVPFPTNNWTWQQFAADAKKLTKAQNGRTTQWGALLPSNPDQIEPLVMGKGGSFISKNGTTMQGFLDSPKSISMFNWYVNLSKKVSPSLSEQNSMSGVDLFGTGKVAMNYTIPVMVQNYLQNHVDFGTVMLPHWPGKRIYTPTYFAGYGISSKSPNKELAWEFLNTLLNPQTKIGQMWAMHGLPAFKSLSTSSVYKASVWRPFIQEMPYVEDSVYFKNPFYRPAENEYLTPALQKMMSQSVNIGSVLKTTTQQMDTYYKAQAK